METPRIIVFPLIGNVFTLLDLTQSEVIHFTRSCDNKSNLTFYFFICLHVCVRARVCAAPYLKCRDYQ